MKLWIKASIIAFTIAIVVLFFQYLGFLKEKKNRIEALEAIAMVIAPSEEESIKLLKDSLFASTNSVKYANFALQLSSIYSSNGKYDSAAWYKELIAKRLPKDKNWESAGLVYFEAFNTALGEEKEKQMAIKAIYCLEMGFGSTSSNRVKLALVNLYFAYDKPEEALDLLQQVLDEDALSKEALYLMGIHYFQINEFEKASDYLGRLIEIDTGNVNGLYFLAVCNVKLGNKKEAKVLFKRLKLLDISDEVKAQTDEYLSDIK